VSEGSVPTAVVVALLDDSLQCPDPCDVLVVAHDQPSPDGVEHDGLYTGEAVHRTSNVVALHHPQESVNVQDRPLHGCLLTRQRPVPGCLHGSSAMLMAAGRSD
jgi:hypothetical protein